MRRSGLQLDKSDKTKLSYAKEGVNEWCIEVLIKKIVTVYIKLFICAQSDIFAMEICSLKGSQAMINLSGSCPNIHAIGEEETLCPLPQQKENLAALKKNSWKWLSLPYAGRSPLSGRRFSWNSSSKNRSKRASVKFSAQGPPTDKHPLGTTTRARAHSISAVAMDDTDGISCASVEDSFAEIKHQLVSITNCNTINCCDNELKH